MNETKSTYVTYTLKRQECPSVFLNNIEIPRAPVAKYLSLHLDGRLTWKTHNQKTQRDGYKDEKILLVPREKFMSFGGK